MLILCFFACACVRACVWGGVRLQIGNVFWANALLVNGGWVRNMHTTTTMLSKKRKRSDVVSFKTLSDNADAMSVIGSFLSPPSGERLNGVRCPAIVMLSAYIQVLTFVERTSTPRVWKMTHVLLAASTDRPSSVHYQQGRHESLRDFLWKMLMRAHDRHNLSRFRGADVEEPKKHTEVYFSEARRVDDFERFLKAFKVELAKNEKQHTGRRLRRANLRFCADFSFFRHFVEFGRRDHYFTVLMQRAYTPAQFFLDDDPERREKDFFKARQREEFDQMCEKFVEFERGAMTIQLGGERVEWKDEVEGVWEKRDHMDDL